jgi:hypothetical protein
MIALPIPLVHLVLVPGALLLGIILGMIRLGQREIFSLAEGDCPFCGTHQRLGLAGRVFRLPRRVFCRNCQKELDLGRELAAGGSVDYCFRGRLRRRLRPTAAFGAFARFGGSTSVKSIAGDSPAAPIRCTTRFNRRPRVRSWESGTRASR